MQIKVDSPEQYIEQLTGNRRQAFCTLRRSILENLPKGFTETMSYGMIGYVVPHSLYPQGYHCDASLPLPFMSIASQKNYISVYHMGLYADKKLMDWFRSAFPKHSLSKLDIGKSCIRFKKEEHIPFNLIGELSAKMTTREWIKIYEENIKTKT